MINYKFLNIPDSCLINKTIFKKMFYENGKLSNHDMELFKDNIKKITWLYSLRPDTINIKVYKDEEREYTEIEVIEVEMNIENGMQRITEIIMRSIPYPMLVIFKCENRYSFYGSHQKTNLNDESKNIIEKLVYVDWNAELFEARRFIDISQYRFTNFYDLYSDLIESMNRINVSILMDIDANNMAGADAEELLTRIENIDKQILSLRNKLKKETQFSKKMELNIEIKNLQLQRSNMKNGR